MDVLLGKSQYFLTWKGTTLTASNPNDGHARMQRQTYKVSYFNLFDAVAGLRIIRPNLLSCIELQVSSTQRPAGRRCYGKPPNCTPLDNTFIRQTMDYWVV